MAKAQAAPARVSHERTGSPAIGPRASPAAQPAAAHARAMHPPDAIGRQAPSGGGGISSLGRREIPSTISRLKSMAGELAPTEGNRIAVTSALYSGTKSR